MDGKKASSENAVDERGGTEVKRKGIKSLRSLDCHIGAFSMLPELLD
jgi:hypothetical protein